MKTYSWAMVADTLEQDFGVFVDWDERFFICPECGEPIYEEDWESASGVFSPICPVCEYELLER